MGRAMENNVRRAAKIAAARELRFVLVALALICVWAIFLFFGGQNVS